MRLGTHPPAPLGRQEAPAPEAPALPALLKRDELRIEAWPALRSNLRRSTSRRRARQVMDLALHLPGLIALAARIHRAGFGYAARSQPELVFKYLGRYLANSFGTAARLRIMSHHYRTVAARLPDLGKLGLPRKEIVLWSHRVELDTFTIGLCMPGREYLEGDLSVLFSVNGVRLHKVSFSCIPGREAGLEAGTALLVGGSQGFPGTSALIRQASKTIGEISPAAMLILAVQALAQCLGADAILGITADEQTSLRADPEQAKSRYDSFWEMSGGEHQGRFYRLPCGVAWKDTAHLSSGHRPRARRKRELKERILAQIRENAKRLFSVAESLPVVLLAASSIS